MRGNIIILLMGMLLFSIFTHAMNPEENIEKLRADLNGKVIFLMGYPGSGKGTQGKILQEKLQILHVSTGELFREEASSGSELGQKMAVYMNKGEIIPSELTFEYLEQEFSKEKYQNGFILDGYPKNEECFDFILKTLKKKNLELLAALHFDIARNEAERRLLLRSEQAEKRADDIPEVIKERLDSYEKRTGPLHALYKDMGALYTIKVPDTREEMTKLVFKTLRSAIERNRQFSELPRSSYFLTPLEDKEKSTVFHNHVDAQDQLILVDIIKEINHRVSGAQNKIYPVSYLLLGNQTKDIDFIEVYADLPNFHRIKDAHHEAFSTGKMGDEDFNYGQLQATLQVCFAHPHQGVMTEIEEDLYEFSISENGYCEKHLNRGNSNYEMDWKKLPGWKEKMLSNIPKFELHHGFDIKKIDDEIDPPIQLSDLMQATSEAGFQNGGWFIFAKENLWAYRSNEFSNHSYEKCKETLDSQAVSMRKIVKKLLNKDERKFTNSASLEKVHAIWRIK